MIFTNTDGNVYLLHHRQGYSQNITPYNPVNESGRQVGIEQLTFNANGTIQEVIPSYDGVKNKYMSPKLDWEENLSAAYDVTATASENSELATLAFDQNNDHPMGSQLSCWRRSNGYAPIWVPLKRSTGQRYLWSFPQDIMNTESSILRTERDGKTMPTIGTAATGTLPRKMKKE